VGGGVACAFGWEVAGITEVHEHLPMCGGKRGQGWRASTEVGISQSGWGFGVGVDGKVWASGMGHGQSTKCRECTGGGGEAGGHVGGGWWVVYRRRGLGLRCHPPAAHTRAGMAGWRGR